MKNMHRYVQEVANFWDSSCPEARTEDASLASQSIYQKQIVMLLFSGDGFQTNSRLADSSHPMSNSSNIGGRVQPHRTSVAPRA